MLVRTRPFNPLFDRPVDRVFDQLVGSITATGRRQPVVEAAWKDGSLVLTADTPGVPAHALDVSVADRVLTIAVSTDELSWSRRVHLGPTLDPDHVSAAYADGRLVVTVGAVTSAEPRRIAIEAPGQPAIEAGVHDAPQAERDDGADQGTSDNG